MVACPLWLGPFTVHICALPGGPGLGRQAGCSVLSLGSVPICALPRRYLCCETQMELREWFATFLFVQVPGGGGVLGGFHSGEWDCLFLRYLGHQLLQGDFALLLTHLLVHSLSKPFLESMLVQPQARCGRDRVETPALRHPQVEKNTDLEVAC